MRIIAIRRSSRSNHGGSRGLCSALERSGWRSGRPADRRIRRSHRGADHSLRIAPLRLELAPGKVIDTFAYNGTVPGPLLAPREGGPVSIDIRNDTDVDDIVHWHGLYLPSQSDGAMEEGIADGGARRHAALRRSSQSLPGTRWYHSHNVAGTDLTRSLYAGLYGFLIVEPPSDPGRYDQECCSPPTTGRARG
jgi:FtsP/CotA-like multicopper oxidase with cupredoxin domain